MPDTINAVGRLIFFGGIPSAAEVNYVVGRRYRKTDSCRFGRKNQRIKSAEILEVVDKSLTRRAVHRPVNRRQNFYREFFFKQTPQYRLHFPIDDEEQNFFAARFYFVEQRKSFYQPCRMANHFVGVKLKKFFFGHCVKVGVQRNFAQSPQKLKRIGKPAVAIFCNHRRINFALIKRHLFAATENFFRRQPVQVVLLHAPEK